VADRTVWSAYLGKRGWRDDLSDRLVFRKKEAGWSGREEIQTFFDYIDADEGRA
jgi:gluconokinase